MQELDQLLDQELDDLSDIPTFDPFPAGVHRVLLSLEAKEKPVAGHPSVECLLKMVEVQELEDTVNAVAPDPGSEANCLFMLDNEFGQGKLKMVCKVMAPVVGSTNTREIVDGTTDIECFVITGLRADKEDKDKFYMDIKELKLA